MTEKVLGHIPANLIYVSRPEQEIRLEWDDEIGSDNSTSYKVLPSFAVEAGNAKTLETAVSWAKWGRKAKPPQLERKNEAFHITLRGLEKRDRGGRAYKVVDSQGYYFDLREDVLLDVMLHCDITQGQINADFIWAKVGAQMTLVRVGSELHTALIKSTQLRDQGNVSLNALVPGGVYQNRKGLKYLVIGMASTLVYEYEEEVKPVPAIGTWQAAVQGKPTQIKVVQKPKVVIAIECPEHGIRDQGVLGWLKKVCALKEGYYRNYVVAQNSLSVAELVETVSLPDGVWDDLRGMAAKYFKHKDNKEASGVVDPFSICYMSHLANLAPLPSKPSVHANFQQYHDMVQALIQQ